jgi:enoyl-CoA hydratase
MTSGTGKAFETIRYEVDGPVCTITLDRPEVANAQDTQLLDELDAGFDLADEDDDVRVVILAGEGKHFSAGHDLKQLLSEGDRWA